jgi:hypothetical protein
MVSGMDLPLSYFAMEPRIDSFYDSHGLKDGLLIWVLRSQNISHKSFFLLVSRMEPAAEGWAL